MVFEMKVLVAYVKAYSLFLFRSVEALVVVRALLWWYTRLRAFAEEMAAAIQVVLLW